MAEKEDKYVVFKLEDLKHLCEVEQQVADSFEYVARRYNLFRKFNGKPIAKYIVCNQDEPYADDVWNTILEGEDKK